jgi:hypothetical protein
MTGASRGALVACALGWASGASAQATLVTGLGGDADFGANVLPASDDGSSPEIDLVGGAEGGFPSGIVFFGDRYAGAFVNTNGSVTLRAPLAAVNHADMPRFISTPIIAPWFAQADTTPGTQPGDPAGANRVYWDLRANQFTVTWFLVGYDNAHTNLRNSFQLIIRQVADMADGVIEVEFRYNQCRWTSGDGDGGSDGRMGWPAQAGMAQGDGTDWFTLPGSSAFTADVDICGGTNVGTIGVYRFRPDRVIHTCDNGYWEWPERCDYGASSPICMDCGLVDAGPGPDFDLVFLDAARRDASTDAARILDTGWDAGVPAETDAGPVGEHVTWNCGCVAGSRARQHAGLTGAVALACAVARRRRRDRR